MIVYEGQNVIVMLVEGIEPLERLRPPLVQETCVFLLRGFTDSHSTINKAGCEK